MISLPKRRDARSRAVHGAFEPSAVFEPTRPQQQTETTSAGDVHKRKPAYLPKTWEVGTNSNCCNRAAAQVKQHIPEQPG